MSDECKYYYYDNGYCCALKREKEGNSSIDSDLVHSYCWNYHYEDCPRYRNRDSSGGCFITSACVDAKGLPDDCDELTILRTFRDEYVRSTPNGNADIKEYYNLAPAVVSKIKEKQNEKEIFEKIYNEMVLPCVELIKTNRNQEAYEKYIEYTKALGEMYLCYT